MPRSIFATTLYMIALSAATGACSGPTEIGGSTQGPSVPALNDPSGPWASVAVGDSHTCALDKSGTAYCWGQNDRNQLGDSTATPRNVPTAVRTLLRFSSIAAGRYTTCGIAQSGDAYCWGFYNTGVNTPTLVEQGRKYVTLAVGEYKVCGLSTDNGVYCWTTIRSDPATPTRLPGNLSFRSVVSALWRFCGITTDSQVYCWIDDVGWSASVPTVQPVPASVSSTAIAGGDLAQITDIYFHGCAIRSDAAVICWGANAYGQLGDSTHTQRATAVPVSGGLKFSAIGAADNRSCGVTTAGELYCWGAMMHCYETSQLNDPGAPACKLPDGRTGAAATTSAAYPVRWLDGTHVVQVAVSTGHNCAITGNGAMYCWGTNDVGQLGRGSTGGSSIDMQQVVNPP
jgi:alpha-tubulin suppressor-like RCC1 family protein